MIGGPDDQEPEILRRKQKDAENAIRYLKKYAYEKTGLFQEKELISETDFFADIREEATRAVGSVLEAVQSLGEHQDRQSTLNAQRDSLLLWQDLPVPLETRETRSSRVFIGSIAAPKTAESTAQRRLFLVLFSRKAYSRQEKKMPAAYRLKIMPGSSVTDFFF